MSHIVAEPRYVVMLIKKMLVKLSSLTRRELALRAFGLDFELFAVLILIANEYISRNFKKYCFCGNVTVDMNDWQSGFLICNIK
jgi:hypothetical protein